MNNYPLVSIIIPVWGVEKFIKNCIYSVINQSYKNIEIIIINDYTEDHSMEIVRSFVDLGYQFRIVEHSANKGISETRNTGIRIAKGEFLYFLDSDDELPPKAIETLVNLSMKYNFPDMTIARWEMRGSDRLIGNPILIDQEYLEHDIFNAFITYKLPDVPWNKLLRRDFIINNDLWFQPDLIHEDTLWSFFCYYYARNIAISKEITHFYSFRPGSLTSDKKKKNIDSMISLLKIENAFIKKNDLYEKFVNLYSYIVNQKYSIISNCIKLHLSKKCVCEIKSEINKEFGFSKSIHMLFISEISFKNKIKAISAYMPFYFYKTIYR